MRVLVIRAHPLGSDKSRSMAMTDAFLEGLRSAHPNAAVDEVRLYDTAVPEIDLDLMSAWEAQAAGEHFSHLSAQQQNKLALFDQYTKQFLAADLVVIANPLWNLSIPTRLKAWIDTVCRSGISFRYNESGEPEGLITGKKVVHLQASGGHFNQQDPATQYVAGMFRFLGCEVESYAAEGMDHEPDRAEEIMQQALAAVRELAASL
ncbi:MULTISPECIES: FMN-dependent NADH-azoreductase [unclassified Brachybacterium]|uniref:FMN-dependent NADH-azoreductase n=1 Tax=unclassified Brachybacterium TaxID=2623841 RepID=UPI000C80D4ED|nr:MULTISPECIES: NAD(P)H-dependent oxidoreductase [unclassified Brachybacterium]PMC75722.1 FMN-dependent NADH-azoreductase [Brachybacterium sp. UMB0905]